MFALPYDLRTTAKSPPDVFISYARRDYEQVRRITDQFAAMNVGFWLDQRNIDGGENFAEVIARSVKVSRVFVLMCSDAALRSRNVNREIILAWKYALPYLPLLLEPVSFPEQVEYFLEGVQWIEVLDRPAGEWLPRILRALSKAGVACSSSTEFSALISAPSASSKLSTGPLPQTRANLASLRALASFNDCIWPIAADSIPPGQRTPTSFRGLGAPQKDVQRTYQIGSRLGIAIYAQRAGHLLLIDQEYEGNIYCLCPSWFAPNTRINQGMNYLPQPNLRYQSFELSGQPGREQLLAIISDEPLDLDWMTTDANSPSRELNSEDVESLLTHLLQLNPASWVALATYFDVMR